ncbi:MAG TPA: hypothetical protein VIK18_21445 [Pirellulales bacterium]
MFGRPVFLCVTAVLLLVDAPARAQPRPPVECTACNGSAFLCDKRYNEVAYPATHHSMSCRDERWFAPNQNYTIARQLADGVRALTLEVHNLFGKTYLARGNALVGRKLLVDGLAEVRAFMDSHPCEIITLIFESHVPAADMAAALRTAGLIECLYAHAPGQPFPTLKEMVLSYRRLVIFTDREGGAYPWYHALGDYCLQTPANAKRPTDLTNQRGPGADGHPLCILNHFLTSPITSPRLALQVNYNPLFEQRVERFIQETRRVPNFVVVDHYELGALFEVVDTINGLPWPQRRRSQPRPVVQATMFEDPVGTIGNEDTSTSRTPLDPPNP